MAKLSKEERLELARNAALARNGERFKMEARMWQHAGSGDAWWVAYGFIKIAEFYGPDAERLAEEYVDWKNKSEAPKAKD